MEKLEIDRIVVKLLYLAVRLPGFISFLLHSFCSTAQCIFSNTFRCIIYYMFTGNMSFHPFFGVVSLMNISNVNRITYSDPIMNHMSRKYVSYDSEIDD